MTFSKWDRIKAFWVFLKFILVFKIELSKINLKILAFLKPKAVRLTSDIVIGF